MSKFTTTNSDERAQLLQYALSVRDEGRTFMAELRRLNIQDGIWWPRYVAGA